jgi:hypothetical protein
MNNQKPIVLLYSISQNTKNIYYGIAKNQKQTETLYSAMNKENLRPLYYKKFSSDELLNSWVNTESNRLKTNKFKPFFTKQLMHPYFIRSTCTDKKTLVAICKNCEVDLNHLPPPMSEVCPSTVLDSTCYFCGEKRSKIRD